MRGVDVWGSVADAGSAHLGFWGHFGCHLELWCLPASYAPLPKESGEVLEGQHPRSHP